MKKLILLTLCLISFNIFTMPLVGRMGVGMTNQLQNDLEAISFKVQRSRSMALGAMIGLKSNEDASIYGLGLKLYRVIYDEPQLNFYMSGTMGFFNYPTLDDATETKTGYQLDGTMGTEFHLSGIESIGFSFEFGMSLNNVYEKNNFQTVGNNVLQAAIHFYL